jgi:hypothetical protein
MHTIILIRTRLDRATKTYVARRVSEGQSSRDAQRCLERSVCRQILKIAERRNRPNEEEILKLLDKTSQPLCDRRGADRDQVIIKLKSPSGSWSSAPHRGSWAGRYPA